MSKTDECHSLQSEIMDNIPVRCKVPPPPRLLTLNGDSIRQSNNENNLLTVTTPSKGSKLIFSVKKAQLLPATYSSESLWPENSIRNRNIWCWTWFIGILLCVFVLWANGHGAKYLWIKYFVICYPKIARFSNEKGTLTGTKWKRKPTISSGNHTLLNPNFAQLQYI